MAVVLVTRPCLHASSTVDRLQTKGFEVLHEPLLKICPTNTPRPDITGSPVVVLTSASALAGLAERRAEIAPFLSAPCFCVGAQTAMQAQAFGFTQVVKAPGDGTELARLVLEHTSSGSFILHPCGVHGAREPAQTFAAAPEWCYRPWVVYEAKATQTLSAICQKRLALGEVNYALFYSVRTAEIFERLVKEGALAACCETLTAVGLSEAVGQALRGLPFRQVWCAPEPTEDSLFSLFPMGTQHV